MSPQSDSAVRKLFSGPDGEVNYTCPQCGRSKTMDISNYFNLDRKIRFKIKCPCGYEERIMVERRDCFRKNTLISGVYLYERKPERIDIGTNRLFKRKPIEVINISSTGLRFRIIENHHLKVGDIGIAEFVLNDRNQSLIRQKVEIKNINNEEIGARFCLIDLSIGNFRNINFYLFNE